VRVDLSTHDAGGITALDVELARRMEALLPGEAGTLPIGKKAKRAGRR
jgi:hypothetical protein